ncbi:MAG: type II toxin-antitoxin system RelE/ParE family toxin, partial [Dehalococcoidia bacterium]
VERESPRGARTVVRQIRTAVRRLYRHPASGRIVPEFGNPVYREVIAGRYRVVYRLEPDERLVRILMVVHGSRLLPPLPDE